ncbi:unnamed protein product [Cercospora beticola]|nr:unnamed protein product [Cercospora beticola]
MADPLSIASGIAGLITLADIIIERTYRYIKNSKNATKDAQRLLLEIQSFSGVLHSLRVLELQVGEHALQTKIDPFQRHQCHELLEEIRDKLSEAPLFAKTKTQKIERTLKWHWTADQAKDLFSQIDRHRASFNLVTSMESLETVLKLRVEQGNAMKELIDVKAILLRIKLDQETNEMLDFFGTFDSQANHATSVSLRSPGTGLWLTSSEEFQKWQEERNSKLWLSGIPGAGKTVLAGLLVQEMLNCLTPSKGGAFHYCDYKKAKSGNIQNILASIVGQLAMQSSACTAILRGVYKPSDKNVTSRTLPHVKELMELLKKMALHFGEIMLVVDALDESEDQEYLSRTLHDLVKSPNCNIKLAALSRDEQDIRQNMSDFDHVSIAARSSDLRIFVAAEIEERSRNRKLRIRSPGLEDEILDCLINGADGMFRWVVCQMDHLCQLPTDAARRKALKSLPPDLETTYERILARVEQANEHTRTLVRRVLMWLVRSPDDENNHEKTKHDGARLSAAALCQAVSINVEDREFEHDAAPDVEEILICCSSLVRLSHDGHSIELAHFTVEEYLLNVTQDMEFGKGALRFHTATANDYRLSTCLTMLLMRHFDHALIDDSSIELRRIQHPFYHYAALLWPRYYKATCDSKPNSLALELFSLESTANFQTWAQCYLYGTHNYLSSGILSENLLMVQPGPLHFACLFSFPSLVTELIEQEQDVNGYSLIGVPLHCAMLDKSTILSSQFSPFAYLHIPEPATERSKRVVSALLGAGAQRSAFLPIEGKELWSMLRIACMSGHLGVLLDHGYMPDQESLDSLLGCHNEAWYHEATAQLQSRHLQHIDGDIISRLMSRSRNVHSSVVAKLLPDTGDTTAKKYISALRYAVTTDDVGIVKEIHSRHDQGLSYMLALDFASRRDDDEQGIACTLLRLALREQAFKVANFLIDQGANIHEQDRHGETLLDVCCIVFSDQQSHQLVEHFLKSGVALRPSSFTYCIRKQKVELLSLIMDVRPEHGIGNVCDEDGETLWHHIVRSKHCGLVDLFKKRAPSTFVESMMVFNAAGEAPMHLTVSLGLEAMLRDLLDKKVPMHLRTTKGDTMLHLAARFLIEGNSGDKEPMRLLINAGHTMEHPSGSGLCRNEARQTALDFLLDASTDDEKRDDCEEGIMLLLPTLNHATLLSYTHRSRTLLTWAADLTLASTVRFLLAAGADVDQIGEAIRPAGMMPLEYLVERCSDAVLLSAALKSSCAIHTRSKEARSLLCIALESEAAETDIEATCKALLDAGYDPDIRAHVYPRRPPIVAAVCREHLSVAELLIEHGADVSACDDNGSDALFYAVRSNDLDFARYLISSSTHFITNSYNLDSLVQCNDTALGPVELAAGNGDLEMLELLMPHRQAYLTPADVSPLWIACWDGKDEVVDFLLLRGESLDAVNLQNGSSILHAAAHSGSRSLIERLINSGHEFIIHDHSDLSPVDYAMLARHEVVVGLLEEYERSRRIAQDPSSSHPIGESRNRFHAAVTRAIKENDLPTLRTLHAEGWDPNDRYSCGRCTALMNALLETKVEIGEFLIDLGVSPNVRGCRNHAKRRTVWEIAASEPPLAPVLERLLRRQEEPRMPNRSLVTRAADPFLLHIASSAGNGAAVKLLLARGAHVDDVDDTLATPLIVAATKGHEKILSILLGAGATINARNRNAMTALILATYHGHEGVVRQLLTYDNIDLHVQSIHGLTALPYAADRCHLTIVQLLVGQGLNLDDRNAGVPSARARLITAGTSVAATYALQTQYQLHDFNHLFRSSLDGSRLIQILRKYPSSFMHEDLNTQAVFQDIPMPITALYYAVIEDLGKSVVPLLSSGALLNLEGGEEGTPLMAACALGRLSLAKLLIRLGATEYYIKDGIVISALKAARHFPKIQHWLLVGRYTDQPKLTHKSLNIPDETTTRPASTRIGYSSFTPWSAFDRNLVFEEDWPAYLKKIVPPSTRSFICRMEEGISTLLLTDIEAERGNVAMLQLRQ